MRKALMILPAACLALLATGCASRGYYDERGYYNDGYHDRYDRYHDRDSNRGGNTDRVRVCDADGDDCHWEYRRP